MALDTSKIVSAVNNYLYSISDTAKAASATADANNTSTESVFQKHLNKYLNNIASSSVDVSSEITQNIAAHNVDIKEQIAESFAQHSRLEEIQAEAVSDADKVLTGSNSNTNADAYSGLLSTGALKELADSAYFSSNLIQSSLVDSSSSDDDAISLSDLNSNSLLKNALGTTADSLTQSDYAAALLSAYKTSPVTSVFGDFSL